MAQQLWDGDLEGKGSLDMLDPPEVIGRYEVLGRLGSGGMGTVYLASAADGARVAIKVIRAELAADREFLVRFRREVEAARRVAAFCTARVLDAELDGPTPYLVTEYIEGPRLDKAISANGPLDASSLEGFAVGVAAALTAIHGAGLVHRDLKPGNVLLSAYGPRVIDFGIARALTETADVTQTGLVLGTPGWMAPEQLAGGPLSAASDVYLWGCLVAYAATGAAPPDLTGLQGRLRELVEASLAKSPARRPTAKAVLLGLLGGGQPDPEAAATQLLQRTWVRTARPTAAAPLWPAPAPPRKPRRRWYRRKRVLIPLAVVILLVIGASAGGDQSAPAATATVGQPARDGKFEFLVTAVTCGQEAIGNEVLNQQAQGQYCLIDVSVTNVGSEGQTLHTGSQHLYDATGNEYRSDGGAGFYLGSALGGWIEINPGNGVSGTLVYDIPPTVEPARIELHDSPFSGGVSVGL